MFAHKIFYPIASLVQLNEIEVREPEKGTDIDAAISVTQVKQEAIIANQPWAAGSVRSGKEYLANRPF